jgi:RecQ family ATP-dependent DNA helicase
MDQGLLQEKLTSYFGHKNFRGSQLEVVQAVLSGKEKDFLVIMPTGGGKSLCYQLPAMLFPGLTVVVSPLIALMEDQVLQLKNKGISAFCLHHNLSKQEQLTVENRLRKLCSTTKENSKNLALVVDDIETTKKQGKILYLSPEKLCSPKILNLLQSLEISLFAIDEAHCVSIWGRDFRESYLNLGIIREKFADVPILALTATADKQTREDIKNILKIDSIQEFLGSFERKNIYYRVEPKIQPLTKIRSFLRLRKDQAGIIYCLSREATEHLALTLRFDGYKAKAYHAGLEASQRSQISRDFLSGEIQIVVATIAFGMGVDKPDVRFVIHWNLPKNLESYYQETGRAGRDGKFSETLLLFDEEEAQESKQFFFHEQEKLQTDLQKKRRKIDEGKFQKMLDFAKTNCCRRLFLLNYFQEEKFEPCLCCDNCENGRRKIKFKEVLNDFQWAAGDLKPQSKKRAGNKEIPPENLLKIVQKKLQRNRSYKPRQWQTFCRQLLDLNILRIKNGNLSINSKAEAGNLDLIDYYNDFDPDFEERQGIYPRNENLLLPSEYLLYEKLKLIRRGIKEFKQTSSDYLSDMDLKYLSLLKPLNQEQLLSYWPEGSQYLEYFPEFFDLVRKLLKSGPYLKLGLVTEKLTLVEWRIYQKYDK